MFAESRMRDARLMILPSTGCPDNHPGGAILSQHSLMLLAIAAGVFLALLGLQVWGYRVGRKVSRSLVHLLRRTELESSKVLCLHCWDYCWRLNSVPRQAGWKHAGICPFGSECNWHGLFASRSAGCRECCVHAGALPRLSGSTHSQH